MKLLSFLLIIALHASARTYSQEISISLTDAHLETVFRQIRKQTHYKFIYTREQLRNSRPVTVNVKKASVAAVLDSCFRDQPLTYLLEENVVIIRIKEKPAEPANIAAPVKEINGRITNEQGEPLVGVTIALKGTNKAVASNEKGEFRLDADDMDATLVVTSIGYQRQEVKLQGRSNLLIVMKAELSNLDETVVIAYGSTTRRFNTGSVSKLSADEISKQPVSNPLATLQGRIPGLVVTQSNGLPGSAFSLQVRGKSSLSQGTQPLFIVDGVPFMINSASFSQSALNATTQSPLNVINPGDIESIEVLKDADATAIYGSQGANGVVIITTKKGRHDKTSVGLSFYSGFGKVTRTVDLLGTPQYLAMRREAFKNDGVVPTISSAPDLMVWDSTKFTNWKELLIGGSSKINNIQASISGSSKTIQYLLSSNFFSEATVFPESRPATRSSTRLNLSHQSPNGKLRLSLSTAYAMDKKRFTYHDLTRFIYLPPNTPNIYDSSGNLNWANGFDNPLSYLHRKYHSETDNVITSIVLQYNFLKSFFIDVSAGYNYLRLREQVTHPIKSQRPSPGVTGSAEISGNNLKSWLIEPQIRFQRVIGNGRMELLTGTSIQQRKQFGEKITGVLFTSDDLLGNMSSAGQVIATNNFSEYKYAAVFGRFNYNLHNRYIVNVNMRRDGSSRFGSDRRFSNFGAFGIAWIFSDEPWFKKKMKGLTFGKIRGSIGVSGNDQVGDYQFLDAWSVNPNAVYQGSSTILPTQLSNSVFEWEKTRKLEAALELGVFQNRALITIAYYNHRGSNQLVYYKLPTQTGFTTILKNLDAVFLNSGFEIDLNTKLFNRKSFIWSANFNITVPKSKLRRYPNLSTSSDRFIYEIGQPLDIFYGFEYLGINDSVGVYAFSDLNKDGRISTPSDIKRVGRLGQRFYGGILNSLSIGGFQVDMFFEFRSQTGRSYLSTNATRPGSMGNQPVYVLDRWQKKGDQAEVQKYTTIASSAAFIAYNNFRNSSAVITDASFVRLKNLTIAYNFGKSILKRLKIDNLRFFIQGQNVLTLTNYRGADPETQNLLSLPPIRVVTFGVQANL